MCKHILINNFDIKTDLDTLTQFASMTADNQGFGAILRYLDGGIVTLKSLDWTGFYIGLTRELVSNPPQTLVVHHRTSTNGDGIDYTHPFEFKGNYLTHNGVVDVPGTHETKTLNDSEALLHHLIKTDWETETVRGYYSCFVLTADSTTVLVDKTAPMYTDGRVYSSHKLYEAFYAIMQQRLTLDRQGEMVGQVEIELSQDIGYGANLAHLSLGSAYGTPQGEYATWEAPELSDAALEFLDSMTDGGYEYLTSSVSENELELKVEDMAANFGMRLAMNDIYELVEYFLSLMEEERPKLHAV